MSSLLSDSAWRRISIDGVRIPQLALTALWAFAIAGLASGTDVLSARWIAGFLLGSAASMAGVAIQPRWNRLGIASAAFIVVLLVADIAMNGILNGAWARSSSDDRESTIFALVVTPACVALGLWLRRSGAAHRGQRAVAWSAFVMGIVMIVGNLVAIVFAVTGSTMWESWFGSAEWKADGVKWVQNPIGQMFELLAVWPPIALVIAPLIFVGLSWSDRSVAAGRNSRLIAVLAATAIVAVMGTCGGMVAMVMAIVMRVPEPERGLPVLFGSLVGYAIGFYLVWQTANQRPRFVRNQRRSATLPIAVARAVSAMRRELDEMTESASQQQVTDTGYRGARLGPPFVYQWIDQEPTPETWRQRADKHRYLWTAVLFVVLAICGVVLGGNLGLAVAAVYLMPVALMIGYIAYWGRRTDGEPIPRPVVREAYIELVDDEFCFVLEVDGKPHFWDRWSRVQQFEVTPYWAMFGDAGESPYKTGWHAIAMDPGDTAPWCIASTIERMADVRQRRSTLDAKFGIAARTNFLQRLELERSAAKREKLPSQAGDLKGKDPITGSPSDLSEKEPAQRAAGARRDVPLKL